MKSLKIKNPLLLLLLFSLFLLFLSIVQYYSLNLVTSKAVEQGQLSFCYKTGPPQITAIPDLTIATEQFVYDVVATDPGGLTLVYSDNTTLFEINSSTGRIVYNFNSSDLGAHSIRITVRDEPNCTSSFEDFLLTIQEPAPPAPPAAPGAGAGGGGGGGPVIFIPACTTIFECGEWSICSEGKQTHECTNIGTCPEPRAIKETRRCLVGECEADAQCPKGFFCQKNICVESPPPPPPPPVEEAPKIPLLRLPLPTLTFFENFMLSVAEKVVALNKAVARFILILIAMAILLVLWIIWIAYEEEDEEDEEEKKRKWWK